ncbi:MAG: hypothetical protein ACRDY3_07705, partial [Acidimicrobiales bacterium]
MIFTRIAVGGVVAVLGVLCWLAVSGLPGATEVLVTLGALVVLVGGGNWLGGRSSAGRASPRRGPAGPGVLPLSGPPADAPGPP